MNTESAKGELNWFLNRLNDYATIDLIREINSCSYSEPEDLCSDPYEDMNIQIDRQYFYIEEHRWPLVEMKEIFYQWLFSINRKAKDYVDEIEYAGVSNFRASHMLKFKSEKNENGKVQHRCESLCKANSWLTFIQYCNEDDCRRMLHKLKLAKQTRNLNLELFKSKEYDVRLAIEKNWFTLKKLSESSYSAIGIPSGEQLLQEWLEYIAAAA